MKTGLETPEDKVNRLKQWQDKLQRTSSDGGSPVKVPRARNQTGIDQEEVRAALRLSRHQEDSAGQTNHSQRNSKTKEHDNDEGFEETQSLMSESPSQGK